MKRLLSLLTSVLLITTAWAQSPEKMTYQSVIRNSSDQLLTNQDMGMQISILHDNASGTAVYVETHSLTSNANGLVTIEIGSGTTSDDFSEIDWASGPYFLKIETDPTTSGGTNYTITGTSQLLSVPYAFYAKTADSLSGEIIYTETDPIFSNWNKDYNDFTNTPNIVDSINAVIEKTTPKISFRAYNSSLDTKSSSGVTKIEFDNILFEIGTGYDNVNDRFIAPISGVYHFSASMSYSNVSVGVRVYLFPYVNNNRVQYIDGGLNQDNDYNTILAGSFTLNLNAGDYVELFAYIDDSSYLIGGGSNYYTIFQGFLVHATD